VVPVTFPFVKNHDNPIFLPNMNTANIEMHNFEINWKVPSHSKVVNHTMTLSDHVILVGASIVLYPPTKAADL
jgi:hypothetical protein